MQVRTISLASMVITSQLAARCFSLMF